MNRMFFGDARDLFKFDLVRHIMKAFPDLLSFTFVPMLTEEESTYRKEKDRNKRPRACPEERQGRYQEPRADGGPGPAPGD